MAGGSRGPGLRERKRELLRRSIEEAAAAVFDERGVDGARIAEIARRAVVSEATLYNHYANKSALADGWVRRRLQGAAGDAVSVQLAHGLEEGLFTVDAVNVAQVPLDGRQALDLDGHRLLGHILRSWRLGQRRGHLRFRAKQEHQRCEHQEHGGRTIGIDCMQTGVEQDHA